MNDLTIGDLDELKGMQQEMLSTLEMIKTTLRSAGENPNWIAVIEMALSHDHEWVGGTYDVTMEDTMTDLAIKIHQSK